MLDVLHNKRLIFLTGKGGVGKSTSTAAVADALARSGKRVLVVETDTYAAMGEMLGVDAPGAHPTLARENLYIANLRGAECLVSTLKRYLPSERIVRAITQNRVTQAFFASAPSVNEFVLLDQIQTFVEATGVDAWDHVLVDLPASGHAVTFLSVPNTLHGMMRGIGPIASRAGTIRDQIADARQTALIAVCLPEEMPVNETLELAEAVEEQLGRELDIVMVNMIHRSPIAEEATEALSALRARFVGDEEPAELLNTEGSDSLTRLIAGNSLAIDWYNRDMHYLRLLHERLKAEVAEIPMFYEVDDSELARKVSHHLTDGPADDDHSVPARSAGA